MSVARLTDGRMSAGELQRRMRARRESGALVPVSRTPTPIGDRLEHFTQGNAMRTYRADRATAEFDPYTQLSRRDLRRLTGAGYLSARGVEPDVMGQLVRAFDGSNEVDGDPVAWFLREALRALDERRAARRRDRRVALARRAGHRTEYAYRTAQAAAAGYASLWHYRRARGWQ